MARENSMMHVVSLAHYLASSGRYKGLNEIEAALIGHGLGANIRHLEDPALRSELQETCAASHANKALQPTKLRRWKRL